MKYLDLLGSTCCDLGKCGCSPLTDWFSGFQGLMFGFSLLDVVIINFGCFTLTNGHYLYLLTYLTNGLIGTRII